MAWKDLLQNASFCGVFFKVDAGPHDGETIPNEVVEIKYDKDVSLQAAWRIYLGMTLGDVATALNISQSVAAKIEKSQKPQKATLEKLAALYDCRVTQLLLD